MRFGKIFEALYTKVFVSIVETSSEITVYVEVLEKGNVIDSAEQSFKVSSIDEKILNFINSWLKDTPYFYIAVLDNSCSQGIIPSCKTKIMKEYVDVQDVKYICYHNRWSCYSQKADINEIIKRYEKVGVDFVFSPFVILSKFFADKIDTTLSMFALINEDFITLCVFDNSEISYAKQIDMQNSQEEDMLIDESDIDMELDVDNEIDLEDIETEEMDDFGTIEDLDSLDDLDNFEDGKDLEEQFQENLEQQEQDMPEQKDGESFNEDYQRFLLIQSALGEYYKNPNYDSKFIEYIYIADSVGVSGDLKKYFEEEMFLSVYVRTMDLNVELIELAKEELA